MTGATLLQLKHFLCSNLTWILFQKNRFISHKKKLRYKSISYYCVGSYSPFVLRIIQDTKLHWVTRTSQLSVLNLVVNMVTT